MALSSLVCIILLAWTLRSGFDATRNVGWDHVVVDCFQVIHVGALDEP